MFEAIVKRQVEFLKAGYRRSLLRFDVNIKTLDFIMREISAPPCYMYPRDGLIVFMGMRVNFVDVPGWSISEDAGNV